MPEASRYHLVRLGPLGAVGRFTSVDAVSYPRGARVICRTSRGLEVGEVLSVCQAPPAASDGSLVRGVTVEDDLLLTRMEQNQRAAYEACTQLLVERNSSTVLMEVEQLFDGGSLYFYFLGDVPSEVEELTQELAETYDSHVQFRKFVEAAEMGCGPDCGTESAAGCGDSCSTCSLVSACNTGRDQPKA